MRHLNITILPRFLPLLSIGFAGHLQAQDLALLSAGGVASATQSFSIGETFVAHHVLPGWIVTEGFHQPFADTTVSVNTASAAQGYTLGPNPAHEHTVIRTQEPAPQDTPLRLCDMHGRILWQGRIPAGEHSATIPLHQLSQAMYLLQVGQSPRATFRIEKIGG